MMMLNFVLHKVVHVSTQKVVNSELEALYCVTFILHSINIVQQFMQNLREETTVSFCILLIALSHKIFCHSLEYIMWMHMFNVQISP